MTKDYNKEIGRQKDTTNGEIPLLHFIIYLFIIKLVIYF